MKFHLQLLWCLLCGSLSILPAAEKAKKVVFISGKPSHGPMAHEHRAGNMLLAKRLNETDLGVDAVVLPDVGYPKDPSVLEDADTIVVFCTGHQGHLLNPKLEEFDALMKKGTGVVMIHWATEAKIGAPAKKFMEWMGGFCDLNWSVNPHWKPNFKNFPDHPVSNGLEPFSVNDEWYYHMRFVGNLEGVTPILSDLPPPETLKRPDGARSGNPHVRRAVANGESQHVGWAYQRPDGKGRGFGFTGAHNHVSWQNDMFRKVVLNAILWTAHVEVPENGVVSPKPTDAEMKLNLDDKSPKKKPKAPPKPNIVFFLVDDLGQRDIGCYGSEFHETPSIDQLAKEGMLFTNAYATCHVCSPSRASILTGKYPARTNLTEWLGGRPERDYEPLHHAEKLTALPDEEITLAETLKSHGYATANYGKAHVRVDPTTYGFDEEITGWVRSYHYPFGGAYNEKLPAKKGDYYTDKLTDAALDFIERNQDQPFFVHLEHFAVHDPIQGRPDLVEKYRKKLAAMPEQEGPDFILEPNPDGPPLTEEELKSLAENNERQAQQDARVWWVKQKQDNVEFAGMLEATDESLARIRAKLKELGLEENTIIIFTADNGGMSASNGYSANASREALDSRFASSNLPLRGAKGWNYEGGVRVPLIVHWPGRTEPNSTSEAVVTGTDYYPTLLEMMNLPAVPDQHVDGKSFVPALNGDAYERGPVYWHFPHYSNHGYQSPGGAIRSGDFKLLEYYENGTVQLFDLANDIGERNDLAEELPEVVAKLKKQFEDWRNEVDAKMPYPKTATSKPAPGARVAAPPAKGKGRGAVIVSEDLPKSVEKFAPGWTIKNWGGPGMKPGLRKEWGGRKNVLLTHPLSRETPCVLSRSVKIPAGKKTALKFAVNNHPKGNWTLVVRIDGDEVQRKSIEDSSWQEFQFDLTKHAGETIKIELENRASDWAFEAAYWSGIELVE